MAFDLTPTTAQHDLARRAHELAESVIRPVAADYDQRQEFPWPVLEEAAERGFYSPLFYRDLIGDPTGLSLPMFMEELFWGCAGIGLAIVMPALALSAIGQAASPEQMLQWRSGSGTPSCTPSSRAPAKSSASSSRTPLARPTGHRRCMWTLNPPAGP
jgi:acyl-CoA dehydrogenase